MPLIAAGLAKDGLLEEMIQQTRNCALRMLKLPNIADGSLTCFVTLNSLLHALVDLLNLGTLFGTDFEERCRSIGRLADTKSQCRLTKAFALAVQSVDEFAKACVTAGLYVIAITAPEIKQHFDTLMEEVTSEIEQLDAESNNEAVLAQIKSYRDAIQKAALCIKRVRRNSIFGLELERMCTSHVYRIFEVASPASSSQHDLGTALYEMMKDACVQFPLETKFSNMVDALKKGMETMTDGKCKLDFIEERECFHDTIGMQTYKQIKSTEITNSNLL